MTQEGFSLELPDSSVWTATKNVEIGHNGETNLFIEGFGQLAALVDDFFDSGGQDNRGDSKFQKVGLGIGSGVHMIPIRFEQFKGSSDTWGSTSQNDHPKTKLQAFNRALTTISIDSRPSNAAELSVWEYSSSGAYDPIPVLVRTWDLSFSPSGEESPSGFGGSIEFVEATDTDFAIDIARAPTDR